MPSTVSTRVLCSSVVCGLMLAAPCATASARPIAFVKSAAPQEDQAAAHFERGVSLFQDEDYKSALFEFQRAYDAVPDHRVLYNIAVTHVELYDYASAQQAFRRYLEEGGDDIEDDRRRSVEQELAKLHQRVGVVVIETSPPGASVWVRGSVVGQTPLELPLNIGEHELELELEGYASARERVSVSGGVQTPLAVELEPTPQSRSTANGARRSKADAAGPKETRALPERLRLGTWIALGVTAASGVATLTLGSLALRTQDELDEALAGPYPDLDRLEGLEARGRRLAIGADVMLGVTCVAAASALALGIASVVLQRKGTGGSRAAIGGGGLALRF